jgi:outer membrane lipoprotein-sorting protein
MKFLRTAPTRRLLAVIAASVAVIAGGTAIAVAASSGGPVPKPTSLANAVHKALAAPAPLGVTASIKFTNHLIDSSNIVGVDPILTGASGRLWISSDHRIRIELQGDSGDAQAVLDNGKFWVYDPAANTVYTGAIPRSGAKHPRADAAARHEALPSIAEIQSQITKLMQNANVSGAIPSDVAGQAAYTVRVSPKHDGGLLGSAELAWDAIRGVPLRIAVYAAGDSSPVLELTATDISYGKIDPSVFNVSAPADAKVVNVSAGGAAEKMRGSHALRARRSGLPGSAAKLSVQSVASRLHFTLVAPAQLVGLPRHAVRLVDFGGHPGALVTYGENLGGMLVLEQPASAAGGKLGGLTVGSGERRHGLSLPTVSISQSVTGQELDTALGTMVRFTRGGVTYTVLGSVPAAAADAAARAL